jgi:RHS repeat-associated protein
MFSDQARRQTDSSNGVQHEGSSVRAPSISLPKGGGAIRGMGEKFGANPVTGAGNLSVPIATSPGRSGFGPQLTLSYDSGSGNGPFGLGWNLSLPAITRKTDKGLPRYEGADESDVYILSASEDLVPVLELNEGAWIRHVRSRTVDNEVYSVARYRPRIEGLFARIERWTRTSDGDIHWRSISRDNITTFYGKAHPNGFADPRIADPQDPSRIFSWLICESYDDKGNAIVYDYVAEDSENVDLSLVQERNRGERRSANRYLKNIRYGNRAPYFPVLAADQPRTPLPSEWLFEVLFDYGEGHYEAPSENAQDPEFVTASLSGTDPWPVRSDPFSTYRAGFEVRTYRLCRRVLMFHHFPEELETRDCLVRATEFAYRETPIASFITGVTQSGFRRQHGDTYLKKSLPLLEFEYSEAIVQQDVQEVDPESLENLPAGGNGGNYQWLDLDGEGMQCVLVEQDDGWYYKRNVSPGTFTFEDGKPKISVRFEAVTEVARLPSLAEAPSGSHQFLDLAGDGQLDCVVLDRPVAGFFERTEDQDWEAFRPLPSQPNVDSRDPNLRFVDLTGDGHADILITEHEFLTWYPSLGEGGFGAAFRIPKARDEEEGPAVVFADGTQSIFLADMSGDGLTDIVRIHNGEVCYWPNLGYGRFGRKVAMDRSPWFDAQDRFDPRRVRLADIDGSGVTDIIYLAGDGVRLYFNQSGNAWSEPQELAVFPRVDNLSNVQALDLLGNGTACLVWTSPLPSDARRAMRYVDLMGGWKPHLLVRSINNLGAETRIAYAPSTKFYLADREAGQPWVTRLGFPVHVVERVETYDRISRNRFVTRYAYHHGYFDGEEREFRGFGLVEQFDTEEFAALSSGGALPEATNIDQASHVPPMLTKTWFHTGAFIGEDAISKHFEHEYWNESDLGEGGPGLSEEQLRAMLLEDTLLPATIKLPDGTSVSWLLSAEEACEASRALKGSILRQEIYALDSTKGEGRPYSASERNYTIELLQPRVDNGHAVLFAHPREQVDLHYERKLFSVGGVLRADPRATHALTLKVDGFGDVLSSAAIGYGRRFDAADPELTPEDRQKQKRTHVTFTINDVTIPVLEDDSYRTPLPCESRTFELLNAKPASNVPGITNVFRIDELDSLIAQAGDGQHDIPYGDFNGAGVTGSAPFRRPIEHVRTLYRRDDLTGLLQLKELQPLALPGDSYKLAFTPELLNEIFVTPGKTTAAELAAIVENEGRYVHFANDSGWWIPSGRVFFSAGANDSPAQEQIEARAHFFLPRRYRDSFHRPDFSTETTVRFDQHDLLVLETEDALANRVSAGDRDPQTGAVAPQIDYRVLQPRLLTDPNDNRSEVAFDALGMVVGTAVMGKPPPAAVEGDSMDGFAADATDAVVLDHLAHPLADPHAILGKATTRLVYDLLAYQRTKDQPNPQPVVAYTLARETHDAELTVGEQTKIQHSFSYSDGFGREIQKKIQAEPEKINGLAGPPRWVGSGWTIFNNKGNPVHQYEPFFSVLPPEDGHKFEFGVLVGVSSILFYDPVERMVATLHPNHTYEKVVFDPWQQRTYDVNDTVTFDPRTDEDIRGFVKSYFATQPANWQTWHAQRAGGGLGVQEQNAANKAAAHSDTPTVAHFDTLGRTFLTIAHNRKRATGPDEFYPTRVELDIEGNQREVIDAQDRVIMRYDYDLSSNRIHQASMEAGERWMLNDVTDKPIRAWDSRGFMRRMTYDELRRPTGLFVTKNGAERMAERTIYGENQGDAKNHRGRVHQVFDAAGISTSSDYDFKGNLRESTRNLLPISLWKQGVDWAQEPVANGGSFTTRTTYDALSRSLTVNFPDGSVYRPTFNEANLLDKVNVTLRGADTTTPFVTNIDYNAKGQRILIHYANGAETTYAYDDQTFRLIHFKTTRAPGQDGQLSQIFKTESTVQDLSYTYDPAGNITRIADDALLTVWHSNEQVAPTCEYTYDAIYRLIEATGREHIGQTAHDFNAQSRRDYDLAGLADFIAHSNDLQAMRSYTESYEYDAVGNFALMRHAANGGSWTRSYEYDAVSLLEPPKQSNRLTKTMVGNGLTFSETYSYTDTHGSDVHGCMTSINNMKMEWDFKEQLQQVDLGGGGTAFYVYDASGQRVRKMIETQNGTLNEERLYLGGFESYRKFGANAFIRETLHVMDDRQRIALVETKTYESGSQIANPQSRIRYQLGNHLGSASLELDNDGALISCEEYHPYGTTAFQAMNSAAEVSLKRYRFTSRERDEESGLNYHGARYYAPWLGRWTAADPLGLARPGRADLTGENEGVQVGSTHLEGGNPSEVHQPAEPGTNLYAYVDGQVLIAIDQVGLFPTRDLATTASRWKEAFERQVMIGGKLYDRGGTTRGSRAAETLKQYGETTGSLTSQKPTGKVAWMQGPNTRHPTAENQRFIYTEKGGWIDMAHFMFYAGRARIHREEHQAALEKTAEERKVCPDPDEARDAARRRAVEEGYTQEWNDSGASAYSYEDLPSDYFGADFGANYFDPESDKTLAEQVDAYLKALKPSEPSSAPNWADVPSGDPWAFPREPVKNKTIAPMYTRRNAQNKAAVAREAAEREAAERQAREQARQKHLEHLRARDPRWQ